MAIDRSHRFDIGVERRHHCISRRGRRAFFLGEVAWDPNAWSEGRLRKISGIFSGLVAGFAILDNDRGVR